MNRFWRNKKVVVTGADGFVGSHVVEYLLQYGARVHAWVKEKTIRKIPHPLLSRITVSSLDLNNPREINQHVGDEQIVLHLAAVVGNIESNQQHPATSFRKNMLPFLNVISAYRDKRLERFCIVSSASVYSRGSFQPTKEDEGFKDMPEPTTMAYGWAKRMQELLGQWYEKEYGMNIVTVRPFYTYGPRDNFNPKHAHVIPSLIRRAFSSENPLSVWGSGNQIRSFIYVKDFARGILEICEKNTSSQPVNLGVDEQISMKHLTRLIIKIAGMKKKITFDRSKPEGKLKSTCDTKLLKKTIGFKPTYDLEKGLTETIEYYKTVVLPHEKNS